MVCLGIGGVWFGGLDCWIWCGIVGYFLGLRSLVVGVGIIGCGFCFWFLFCWIFLCVWWNGCRRWLGMIKGCGLGWWWCCLLVFKGWMDWLVVGIVDSFCLFVCVFFLWFCGVVCGILFSFFCFWVVFCILGCEMLCFIGRRMLVFSYRLVGIGRLGFNVVCLICVWCCNLCFGFCWLCWWRCGVCSCGSVFIVLLGRCCFSCRWRNLVLGYLVSFIGCVLCYGWFLCFLEFWRLIVMWCWLVRLVVVCLGIVGCGWLVLYFFGYVLDCGCSVCFVYLGWLWFFYVGCWFCD